METVCYNNGYTGTATCIYDREKYNFLLEQKARLKGMLQDNFKVDGYLDIKLPRKDYEAQQNSVRCTQPQSPLLCVYNRAQYCDALAKQLPLPMEVPRIHIQGLFTKIQNYAFSVFGENEYTFVSRVGQRLRFLSKLNFLRRSIDEIAFVNFLAAEYILALNELCSCPFIQPLSINKSQCHVAMQILRVSEKALQNFDDRKKLFEDQNYFFGNPILLRLRIAPLYKCHHRGKNARFS